MRDISTPTSAETTATLNDAKMAMMFSGKTVPDKLEYAVKVAVIAIAQYLENEKKDPINLFTNDYSARIVTARD